MPSRPQRAGAALIVGASGGLGSALAAALGEAAAHERVFALSRTQPAIRGIDWLAADPTCPDDLGRAAARVEASGDAISLMINCVGTLHAGRDVQPEKSLRDLESPTLQRLMHVNAFAPLAALRAFTPHLRRAGNAVAATLSAMVGSIGDNRLGGWYSYRMSKAALNMGLRNAAIELGRFRAGPIVVAIHPGTTLTPLSEPFLRDHPHRTPADSARQILRVVGRLGPDDNGRFLNWDGKQLPW